MRRRRNWRAPLKPDSEKPNVQLWTLGLLISFRQNYQFRRIRFNKMLKMEAKAPVIRSNALGPSRLKRGWCPLVANLVSAAQDKVL